MTRLFAFAVFFVALAFARGAGAHTVGLSSGEYRVAGTDVSAKIVFARDEVGKSLGALDADRDGFVTPREVDGGRALLEAKIAHAFFVSSEKEMCEARLVDAALVEGDGLMVRIDATCPRRPTLMALGFLKNFSAAHKHVARVFDPEVHDELLSRDRERVELARANVSVVQHPPAWTEFVKLGFVHILGGADHLLFLLGLLLARKSIRELVMPITAFTLAHSVTLALAVLRVVHVNAQFVEPVIAFSIAWVGVENLRGRNVGALVTFPFGLVHGLGFASALTDLQLDRGALPGALLGFNLGVEAGQMLVVAIAIPILLALGRLTKRDAWKRAVAMALVAVGLVWGIYRTLS